MDKKQAAKFLDMSEKTIERYKAAGKLSARMIRTTGKDGKKRQILDFKESELQRLKQELSGEVVFPMVTNRQPPTKTQTDTDGQTQIDILNSTSTDSFGIGQTQTATIIKAIFDRVTEFFERQNQASERAEKLMLSIPEASAISGLPKSYIRQAIKEEKLKAKIIGRGYKIKRQDLNEFINNL